MNKIHAININDIDILSNVFFAPINPGWCTDGFISKKYIDFFANHSGRGIGICYVGNVALQKNWSSNDNTAVLNITPKKSWLELSKCILENGSLPGIQLAWKPPQIKMQKSFTTNNKEEQIRAFKDFYYKFEDCDYVSELFKSSIKYSLILGFPVVQIHAAHGYALSLLLSRGVSGCDNPEETKGFKLLEKIMTKINVKDAIMDR